MVWINKLKKLKSKQIELEKSLIQVTRERDAYHVYSHFLEYGFCNQNTLRFFESFNAYPVVLYDLSMENMLHFLMTKEYVEIWFLDPTNKERFIKVVDSEKNITNGFATWIELNKLKEKTNE